MMQSIKNIPDKKMIHGMPKSEVLNRIADGCGSGYPTFLTTPTGMPEDNPLKAKGKKIMANMKHQYGKKGKEIFYASKNKGIIKGVD